MSNIDEQFVEYIVKSLVGNPDEVQIDRTIDEKGVLLELTVDPEDLGRVIGKRGATAQSIRTLLRALGTKNDARYNLKIVDNGVDSPAPRKEEKPADDAPADDTSSDDGAADEPEEVAEEAPEEPEVEETQDDDEEESLAEKTRKELSDLDDLDI